MKKREVYNPFNTKDYYIWEKKHKKYFAYDNLELELSPEGYIPKSGLLFDIVLSKKECLDKKVLDLGCGYLGILGMIAYINGARKVESIDYDKNCVNWFSKIIRDNNFQNIICYKSNYFEKIKSRDFDLILANPPQMPMLEDSLHDSGGKDGRKFVLQILKESINYLKEDGNLYILLFDFLGVEEKTNDSPTIIEIAYKLGYKHHEIVYEADKKIKEGGVTYSNINYINSVYPNYDFNQEHECKCKIKILKLRK